MKRKRMYLCLLMVLGVLSSITKVFGYEVEGYGYEPSSLRNRGLYYASMGRAPKPQIYTNGRYVVMQSGAVYANSPSKHKHLRHQERIALHNSYRY